MVIRGYFNKNLEYRVSALPLVALSQQVAKQFRAAMPWWKTGGSFYSCQFMR